MQQELLKTSDTAFDFPFEDLLSSSSIIFYQCEIEDNFPLRFISKNVEDILGFGAEALEQNNQLWIERIHPEDRERVTKAFREIEESEYFSSEFRFKHGNGHYIWLYDEAKLVRDDDGKPESLVGTSINITDRKKAEQDLQKLNEELELRIDQRTRALTRANERLKLLEMAASNITDMVIVTKAPKSDPLDSEIVYVNKAFEQFTGYSRKEVKGRIPTFLHGPETSEEALNYVEKKIRNHQPLRVEFVNYTKTQKPYWVELDMAPFPAEQDDTMYWVGINRNITRRKEAAQHLKKEKDFVDVVINSLPGLFYMIDREFNFIRVNDNFKMELGYSREELSNISMMDLFPEESRDWQINQMRESLEFEQESTVVQLKSKDDTTSPYLLNGNHFKQEESNYIVGTGIDISKQKKAEEQVRISLKEKEVLLAEIHHRVKNNLAIISGLLDLQAFNEKNDMVIRKLRESQVRIQSIAMVHEKLYQSESLSSIQMDVYINQLTDYISEVFVDKDVQIKIQNNAESVQLDIRQAVPCGLILNEVITNAFKHAFKGRDEGTICINLHKINKTIFIEIKDDGIGLPEEFNLTSANSLGITLVETLVRQLEAEIDVQSGEKGTSFSFSFGLSE